MRDRKAVPVHEAGRMFSWVNILLRAIVRGDEAPYSGSLSGESRRAKYTCHRAVVMSEPVVGKNKQLASWKLGFRSKGERHLQINPADSIA